MKDGMCVNSCQKEIQKEFKQPQTWGLDFNNKPMSWKYFQKGNKQ